MNPDASSSWLVAALAANGLGAGVTLDQAIKQLPVRHRIGPERYAAYVLAADLANGLVWYPVIGIVSVLTSVVAIVVSWRAPHTAALNAPLLLFAFGVVAELVASGRAVPLLLRLRHGAEPAAVLDRFAHINALRAVVVSATLAATAWAALANVSS